MLYGNIAAIDQRLRSNDAVPNAADGAASHANSGQTVEYALTSRTLLLPADDLTDGVSPNGWSVPGDEARLEVAPRG